MGAPFSGYIGRACVYSIQGQYNKAISDYNKAISINSRYASSYYSRGQVYCFLNNLSQAISDCDRAIKLNPAEYDAYYIRGNVYTKQYNWPKAVDDFNKVIEINPKYADAYFNLGNIYALIGDPVKAHLNYKKAIEINPELSKKKHDDLRYGPQNFKFNPDNPNDYYSRGIQYFEKKEYVKALEDINKARELGKKVDPRLIDVIKRLSNVSGHNNMPKDQGQEWFEYTHAIQLNPNDSIAYYKRALFLDKRASLDMAMADYTKTIEIDPKNAAAYFGRGMDYFKTQVYDKSLADLQKAKELGFKVMPGIIIFLERKMHNDQ